MLNRINFKLFICTSVIQCLLIFVSISNLHGQEICPGVGTAFPDGAIEFQVLPSADNPPDFTAALLGTFDLQSNGNVSGGSDWVYADTDNDFETTIIGGQLIGYFTRKNNKNTYVQVTNHGSSTVEVHINTYGENCLRLCDFCDSYTPKDTHVYNLSDVRRNADNTAIVVCNSTLANQEGFVIITPVDDCAGADRAIAYPQFQGDSKIIDTANNFDYGAKLWARDVDTLFGCDDDEIPNTSGGFKILTGVGDCGFRTVLPSRLKHVFSTLPGSVAARSDLVFLSLRDVYLGAEFGFAYRPMAASSRFIPTIANDTEFLYSCAQFDVCFARFGINDALPNSDTPLPVFSANCDASAPGAIIGTPGDDVLNGTPGNDVIIGLGGNDTINGDKGDDCIDGGPGNDVITGDKGADNIFGESGNDTINGGEGKDKLFGGTGDDSISGDTQKDRLDGGPGNDTLDGGPQNDKCVNGETNISCES